MFINEFKDEEIALIIFNKLIEDLKYYSFTYIINYKINFN